MELLCRNNNAMIKAQVKTQNRVEHRVWHTDPWPGDLVPSVLHISTSHGDMSIQPLQQERPTVLSTCRLREVRVDDLVGIRVEISEHLEDKFSCWYRIFLRTCACQPFHNNLFTVYMKIKGETINIWQEKLKLAQIIQESYLWQSWVWFDI